MTAAISSRNMSTYLLLTKTVAKIAIKKTKNRLKTTSTTTESQEILPWPTLPVFHDIWATSSPPPDQTNFDFYQEPSSLTCLLAVLYIVILVTIVVANLVTISYYFLHRHDGMVVNVYVISLLFADFLWPLVSVPFGVAKLWTPHWLFGSVPCRMMPLFQMLFPQVISSTLCLIAIERYFTVLHPFDANPLLKRRISWVLICLTWFLPIATNSWLSLTYEIKGTLCLPSDKLMSPTTIRTFQGVQMTIFMVLLPGVLFPICYGQIIFSVFNNKQSSISSNIVIVDFNRRLAFEHRKRVVTFFSLLVQFAHFACWLPLVTFQLIHLNDDESTWHRGDLIFFKIVTLLASANAAFNSLVYTAVLRSDNGRAGGSRTASNASTFALLAVLANRTRSVAFHVATTNSSCNNNESHGSNNNINGNYRRNTGDSCRPSKYHHPQRHPHELLKGDNEQNCQLLLMPTKNYESQSLTPSPTVQQKGLTTSNSSSPDQKSSKSCNSIVCIDEFVNFEQHDNLVNYDD